jgi:hypothetical protein
MVNMSSSFISLFSSFFCFCTRGPVDKASASEAEDRTFESCRVRENEAGDWGLEAGIKFSLVSLAPGLHFCLRSTMDSAGLS